MQEFTRLIVDWLQATFHNPHITTVLISVIPMIEVRGAITVGVNLGLNPWLAFVLSCCSALLVCPLLLLCLKPVLQALKRTKAFKNLASAVEETFRKKAEKLETDSDEDVSSEDGEKEKSRKKRFGKMLGIFLFCAVPLPLTGVWTGTAVAAFLDLEYRYSVPSIVLGNFFAGLIITVLNIILGQYSWIILVVLGLFVLISLWTLIITFLIKYNRIRKEKTSENGKQENVKE